MSHSLEELQALQAAMESLPTTDAEVTAFMSDVDAGKHDAVISASIKSNPPEQVIAMLKADREKLRKEALEPHIRLNISDIPKLAEEVTYFLLPSTDESTVKKVERVIRETLMQMVLLPPPVPPSPDDGLRPYAFCCNSTDPAICDCVNKNHGVVRYK